MIKLIINVKVTIYKYDIENWIFTVNRRIEKVPRLIGIRKRRKRRKRPRAEMTASYME